MNRVREIYEKLTPRQRIVVAVMLAVIVLTWLAVCLVIAIPLGHL